MHKIFGWTLFLTILLSCLPSSAEDGGTLRFEPVGLKSKPTPWGLQGLRNNNARSAVMKLDGDEAESVWMWEMEPGSFVIPKTGTPRLFVDLNGDGKYESREVYEPLSSNRYRRNFENVGVPIKLGAFQQIVRIKMASLGQLPGWLHVEKCYSCYVGSLAIDGEQWPAQLEFRSLYPESGDAQATIILDTDRDGVFNPYVDAWIADQGVGHWQGQLKQVETVYSKSEARVSIKPYAGPIATLKIEGEGFYRLHLMRELDGHTVEGESNQSYWFCVPRQKEQVYAMPPGRYTVDTGWLMPQVEGMEGLVFQLSALLSRSQLARMIRLEEGQTLTAKYGGPLEHVIQATPYSYQGKVSLDYAGLNNGSEVAYMQTILPGTKIMGGDSAPAYEVRSSSGKVIDVGKFEFG